MSVCVNRAHPDFVKIVNETKFSPRLIAAVISNWQQYNGLSENIPSVEQFQDYVNQIIQKKEVGMSDIIYDRLVSNLRRNWSKEKGEQGLSVMNILGMFKTAIQSKEKTKIYAPESALKHMLNITMRSSEKGDEFNVTPEYIADSVKGLLSYLTTSEEYLKTVWIKLSSFIKNPDVEEKDKLRALHHAMTLASNYETQLKAIFTRELEDIANIVPSKDIHPLSQAQSSMNGMIANIRKVYSENVSDQIAEILWKEFKGNSEVLNKLFEDNIEYYKELEKKYPEKAKFFQTKIVEERANKEKHGLSKENIKKWLSNPKTSWMSLMMRSALHQKDPSIQLISNYIFNVIEDAKKDNFQDMNRLQKIMKKIQDLPGRRNLMSVRELYKGLYRETVDENGNFALAIQTEIKDQELYNEYIRLQRLVASTSGHERIKAQAEFDAFEKKYVERRYTEEYYKWREEMLSEELKEELDLRRQHLRDVRNRIDRYNITNEELQELRQAELAVKDLQRETDVFGQQKTGKELEWAQMLQAYNKKAQELGIHRFYLAGPSKLAFENALAEQRTLYEAAIAQATTEEEKELAEKKFSNWLSVYTRTVIDPEFYAYRQSISKKIDAILKKHGRKDLSSLYDKLFSMLAGYRDKNGVYDGTRPTQELINATKEIEEEIESLKNSQKLNILGNDKVDLEALFSELMAIQQTVPTEYYQEVVQNRKAAIKTKLLSEGWEDNALLARKVREDFEKSEWFLANHIKVEKYNVQKEEKEEVWEPLRVWKYTHPTKIGEQRIEELFRKRAEALKAKDPVKYEKQIKDLENRKVITTDAPSMLWYDYEVSENFENPNYSNKIKFKVEKDDPLYYNKEWGTLSDKEKEIATELLDYYKEVNDGLYRSNDMRTLIPYVRKENAELVYDSLASLTPANIKDKAQRGRGVIMNSINSLKAYWNKQDIAVGEEDDVYGIPEQLDTFGNPVTDGSKAMYMRFSRPLDKNVMSYDIMKSIALYAGEATRFKALHKNQAVILSSLAVVKQNGKSKNAVSAVEGLINRNLYGEFMKSFASPDESSNVLDKISIVLNFLMKKSGAMSLDQNIQSGVKNLYAGLVQTYIQSNLYDLTTKDLIIGDTLALTATLDWWNNPQVGDRPLQLQLLDHFGAIQSRDFSENRNIKSSFFRKHGNIIKSVHTFRQWTEFQIQASIAYAIFEKHPLAYKDPATGEEKFIKIKDAYRLVNGSLELKEGVELPKETFNLIRAKIRNYNYRTQGLYDSFYQPEGSKYVFYRLLFYMKKWLIPAFDARFRKERYDYATGVRTYGFYLYVLDFLKSVYKNRLNVVLAYQTANTEEKKALKTALTDSMVITSLITLVVLMHNCDEDGDQGMCDYFNWLVKGVADEAESIHPVMLPLNAIHGYVFQKSQLSAPEKFIQSTATPVVKMWKLFTDVLWDGVLSPMEPYYVKTSSGRINWDQTDPFYAGMPAIGVLFAKWNGLSGLDVSPREVEFKSRQWTHFNPKVYNTRMDTKYINEEGDVKKIKRRSELKKKYDER